MKTPLLGLRAVGLAPFTVALVLTCTSIAHSAPAAPVATTADGGSYYGPLVDGKFEGQGRLEYSSGARYQGQFKAGLFHGRGRYENGAAGATYVGWFKAGLFHGRGKYVRSGTEYQGEFKQGMFAGKGEIKFKDGRKYTGDFVRGQMHGKGRFEQPGGDVYEGDFVEDVFTGQGVYTGPGGLRHEGQFRDWRPDGPGKFTAAQGATYEGNFVGGRLEGKGRATSPDASVYEGEFKEWLPHGQGELRRANGDVYRGRFEFGLYSGEGTLTYAKPQPDGRTADTGVWKYGRLQKDEEEARRLAERNVEHALYVQQELLDRDLRALEPRRPDAINMYVLAVGGDGSQEVFRREVEYVRSQFDSDYGTRGKSVILVNSRSTVGKYPLATVTSIRRSLQAIAERMDKTNDILFLYMTSHGSEERELTLELQGMKLPALGANELAAALKETGIRFKVIVISACYAGGFIDAIRDSNTLILTAARHDRKSFGCADENDFTYFGRAYFKESLPQSSSFQAAFAKAETLITEWEKRDVTKPPAALAAAKEAPTDIHSLPQMEDAPAIQAHLALWWSQLPLPQASTRSAAGK